MKKTLALLLAFAGIASAATEIDLTDKWDGSTVNIVSETFTDGQVTLAFMIDPSILSDATPADRRIFTLSGENTNTEVTGTSEIGLCIDQNDLISYRYNSILNSTAHSGKVVDLINNDNLTLSQQYEFKYASIICTISTVSTGTARSVITAYLSLHDANGDIILDSNGQQVILNTSTKGGTQTTNFTNPSDPYSIFSIDSSIVNQDSVELYNGLIIGEALGQTVTDMVKANLSSTPGTDTTVPEPATATLSLLALAGLAARRRRK